MYPNVFSVICNTHNTFIFKYSYIDIYRRDMVCSRSTKYKNSRIWCIRIPGQSTHTAKSATVSFDYNRKERKVYDI